MSDEHTVVEDCIKQGMQYSRAVELWDENDSPIDLIGWSGRVQIRETIASTSVIYDSASTSDIVILPGAGVKNHIQWTLKSATTAGFNFDRAVADLEILDATGEVIESIRFSFALIKEVTR